jgi:hypothetical protein
MTPLITLAPDAILYGTCLAIEKGLFRKASFAMNIFNGQPFTAGQTALVYPQEALLKLMVFILGGIENGANTTVQPARGDQFRLDIHEIPLQKGDKIKALIYRE